ncbi:recombinase family protein [Sphingomonas sp. DC2300-3]|uniref:recombinase family protein n=1 Tax=unclassified Sphingomonas TaxID=196159 RepID=UPI003CEBB44C
MDGEDIDPQLRALRDAGCDPIYQEEASGGRADRPELARAIGALRPGDVFVVWKLDRLSRSLRDLLFTLEAITAAGAGFRSVTEAIDTTTAPGRLMTQMLGAFAEFERAMIRERTMNGLAHARNGYFRFSLTRRVETGLEQLLPVKDEQGGEIYYTAQVGQHLRLTATGQVIDPVVRGVATAVYLGLRAKVDF